MNKLQRQCLPTFYVTSGSRKRHLCHGKPVRIVKLPKKGDLTNCNNWRGIMLLSATYKALSRVVLNRLTTTVDPLLRKEQAGIRKGRGCANQIQFKSSLFGKSWNRVMNGHPQSTQTLLTLPKPLIVLTAQHFGESLVNTGSQTSLCLSSKCFTVITVQELSAEKI